MGGQGPPSSYGSLEAPLARGAVPAPPVLQGHKWGHGSGLGEHGACSSHPQKTERWMGVLGGTQRGQGQQDPSWQSGDTGGGSQADGDTGGLGVVLLAPPLAGHWVGLSMGQGQGGMRGVGGLVTKRDSGGGRRWWLNGIVMGWDSDGTRWWQERMVVGWDGGGRGQGQGTMVAGWWCGEGGGMAWQ